MCLGLPRADSLRVSGGNDVAVGTRSSAPANPPEQFVCSDCGLCVLVRKGVAVGTHDLALAHPPEQFIVGAQDKRTPHGHSRRGQPAMKCAGSLRVSARHGVAMGTRASGPENPLSSFLSRSGQEDATWSRQARPASRDMCGLAACCGSPRRRRGHARVGA